MSESLQIQAFSTHLLHPSTWKMEVRGPGIQFQPQLQEILFPKEKGGGSLGTAVKIHVPSACGGLLV